MVYPGVWRRSICAFRLEWVFFASLMSFLLLRNQSMGFPFSFQADQLVKVVITHSVAPVFSVSSLNIQGKGAPGDTFC